MVTREVVGKTIVSFSTSRGTRASIWMVSPQQGRNLDLLTITEPELAETEIDPNARKVKSYWWICGGGELDCIVNTFPSCNNLQLPLQVKKRVVMVMARQHPGESPASYVVQGLIDFLVSKHKIAQELREKLIFKVLFESLWLLCCLEVTFQYQVIPMMNPDGVYLGNYRGSLLGEFNGVALKTTPC